MCHSVVTGDRNEPFVVIGQDQNANVGDWASRLRESRRLLGLKQSEMAALGGVSLNTQNRYEGGTTPSIEYLLRIGEAGADWYWIISGQRAGGSISHTEARLVNLFRSLGDDAQSAVFTVLECMADNMHSPASSVHDKRQDISGE